MDAASYFGAILLFVAAVIMLGIYATRPKKVVLGTHDVLPVVGIPEQNGKPPAGASGFGMGAGAGVDLMEKPHMNACSTLNRKPAAAEVATAELSHFFQPARVHVPIEDARTTIGDCPPMKPMSSAAPLANVPMCVAKGGINPLASSA